MSYIKSKTFPIAIIILFSNFAFAAPPTEEAIDLKRETGTFRLESNLKVSSIGYRLLAAMPKENKKMHAYLPFNWIQTDSNLKLTYQDNGVIVSGLIDGITPPTLDVKQGDMISLFDGKLVKNGEKLEQLLEKTKNQEWLTIQFKRQDEVRDLRVPILYFPEKASFLVSPDLMDVYSNLDQFSNVVLSAPLLHFAENDDELAFLVAHELAHLAHGDFPKGLRVKGSKSARSWGTKIGSFTGEFLATNSLNFDQSKAGMNPFPHTIRKEVEADKAAIALMKNAGYDPSAALKVVERLGIEMSTESADYASTYKSIKQNGPMNIQHPLNEDRIVMIRRNLEALTTTSSSQISTEIASDDLLGPITGNEPLLRDRKIVKMGLTAKYLNILSQNDYFSPNLSFNSDIKKIYWFVIYEKLASFKNTFNSRDYSIEWFAPDGSVFYQETFKQKAGYNEATSKLDLKNLTIERRTGKWRVRVLKEGHLFDDRYFLIETK